MLVRFGFKGTKSFNRNLELHFSVVIYYLTAIELNIGQYSARAANSGKYRIQNDGLTQHIIKVDRRCCGDTFFN